MQFWCTVLAIVFCLMPVKGGIPQKQFKNANSNNKVDVKDGDLLKSRLFFVREIAKQMNQGTSIRYHPGYKPENYHNCENLLNELLTIHKKLASHLKPSTSPPPPPQIIHVKYHVPTLNHTMDKTGNNVTIKDRIPEDTDTNRIWMKTPKDAGTDDDGDGSRPVSFKPQEPTRPLIQPPPFEHGSTQAGVRVITKDKPFSKKHFNSNKRPTARKMNTPPLIKQGRSDVAVLFCCGLKTEEDRKKCFAVFNCFKSSKMKLTCNPYSYI